MRTNEGFVKLKRGDRFRATKAAEGIQAGDVVRIVKFRALTNGSLDGYASGLIVVRNERTDEVSDHGACVLGPKFLDATAVKAHTAPRKGPFTITVTERDIKKGKPRDGRSCPIARACHRAGFRRWFACPAYIGADNGKEYKTPHEAQQFMRDFDLGRPVQPFTFTLS